MTNIVCPSCKGECYSASPQYTHHCPYCGASLAVNSIDVNEPNKGLSYIYTLINKLRRIQPK